MKNIWLKLADQLKSQMDKDFKKTGSINSSKMDKYMLLIDASERCNG